MCWVKLLQHFNLCTLASLEYKQMFAMRLDEEGTTLIISTLNHILVTLHWNVVEGPKEMNECECCWENENNSWIMLCWERNY